MSPSRSDLAFPPAGGGGGRPFPKNGKGPFGPTVICTPPKSPAHLIGRLGGVLGPKGRFHLARPGAPAPGVTPSAQREWRDWCSVWPGPTPKIQERRGAGYPLMGTRI